MYVFRNFAIGFTILLIIALSPLLHNNKTPTGAVIFETKTQTHYINQEFNETTIIQLPLTNITSLKASGTWNSKGQSRVYVYINNTLFLVFNSENLTHTSSVSVEATSTQSTAETPSFFTQTNLTDNLTTQTLSASVDTTSTNTTEAILFSEQCIDTCSLPIPEANLTIVLRDNATIFLSNLTYTKEKLPGQLTQTKNIPDITLTDTLVINLAEYFTDTNNATINYAITPIHGIRTVIFENELHLFARQQGNYTAIIIATNTVQTTTSNSFTITVPEKPTSKIDDDVKNKLESEEEITVLIEINESIIPKDTLTKKQEFKQKYLNKNQTSNTQQTHDYEVEKEYEHIPIIAVRLTRQGLQKILNDSNVKAVHTDKNLSLTLTESIPIIRANLAQNLNYLHTQVLGQGQTLCILDTGIDANHTAFADRILAGKNFIDESKEPIDDNGHGTHVAGITAANGSVIGVAPRANILSVKVCDSNGNCPSSAILAGIDFCLNNSVTQNISVISGSFSDSGEYNSTNCPSYFEPALNAVNEQNISSVFAAGNNFYQNGISYPACSPFAISVGASTKQDEKALFSNKGDLLDIYAPGQDITSTLPQNTYGSKSGTSMSVPFIAGTIMLIKQKEKLQNFTLSPAQIKQLLKETAEKSIEGIPRIDVLNAVSRAGEIVVNVSPPVFTSTEIIFKEIVDWTNFSECSNLSFNHAQIFSDKCSEYNKSARIVLKGLPWVEAWPLRNGLVCENASCLNASYSKGILSFDVNEFSIYSANGTGELSFSAQQLSFNSPSKGIAVYGEGTITTPRYRLWNGTDFEAEQSAPDIGVNSLVQRVVVKSSPTRNLTAVGILDDDGDILLNVYNNTFNTWDSWLDVADIGTINADFRGFDVSVESGSGDFFVAYEKNITADRKLLYRTWDNAAGWSVEGEIELNADVTAEAQLFVAARSNPNNDEIMIASVGDGDDISAGRWNGTAFVNITTITLTAAAINEERFSIAWESLSDDVMMAWGAGATDTNFSIFNNLTKTWGNVTDFRDRGSLVQQVSLSSDPNSDYICAIIGPDNAADVLAVIWNGTDWLTGEPAEESSAENPKMKTAVCSWTNDNIALFSYIDLNANNITYFTYNKTNDSWQCPVNGQRITNLNNVEGSNGPCISAPMSDEVQVTHHIPDPKSNNTMVLGIDLAEDLEMFIFNGTNLSQPVTNILEPTLRTVDANEPAGFDYFRFEPVATPSACGTVNGSLTLINSVSTDGGTCFDFNTSNVVLDCAGYNITSNPQGVMAFNITRTADFSLSNITIKNCNIRNFSIGINISSAVNISLFNNNITNVTNGIWLNNTVGSVLENISVNASGGFGIRLSNSSNNTLNWVNASNNAGNLYGIYLLGSKNNVLINNTGVAAGSGSGIRIETNAHGNTITDSTGRAGASGNGINLINSNVVITRSVGSAGTSGKGITLNPSNNVVIINSTGSAAGNLGRGIDVGGSSNNITNSTGIGGGNGGIFINTASASNNRITGSTGIDSDFGIRVLGNSNNVTDSYGRVTSGVSGSNAGIFIFANSNIILNSTGEGVGNGDGIFLQSDSASNRIINSTGNSSSGTGIYLFAADKNLVQNSVGNSSSGNGIKLQSTSDHNLIVDSRAISRSAGAFVGTVLSTSQNNTIMNSTGTSNSSTGLTITSTSQNLILMNNTFKSGRGTAVVILTANNTNFTNNTVIGNVGFEINRSTNILITNTSFQETNWSIKTAQNANVSLIDNERMTNYSFNNSPRLTFVKTGIAELTFFNIINANGTNLSMDVNLSINRTHVNTSRSLGLNISANITLFNVPGFTSPQIIVDYLDTGSFEVCASPTCTILVPYASNSITFNVSSFTTYAINETPTPNTPPTIHNLTFPTSFTPQENVRTGFNITINFTATDAEGAADLLDVSALAYINNNTFYRNSSPVNCTTIKHGDNANSRNYSCQINISYYLPAGTWNITVNITDSAGEMATNATEEFTLNELTAFQLNNSFNNSPISFSAGPSQTNKQANNPLSIDNTGNINITLVNFTAFDVWNNTVDPPIIINASNFTVSVHELPTGPPLTLRNNTNLTLTNSTIAVDSDAGDSGNRSFFFFINVSNIPSGIYNASRLWEVRIQSR
ncbi:S8 family serine peptidase [Candidatus Woesearchaeota archaeon]|nr:S8 family serine peptidase [Candidatus Woesearchaeota archaeon]